LDDQGYKLGTWLEGTEGSTFNITFVLTQDCNLSCGYCYISGKNTAGRMTFETAKKAVDYCLGLNIPEEHVVWDFIGGEPLLEVELMDQICDYIKVQMYRLSHKWSDRYSFSFTTNGVLYDTPAVQRFIQKHYHHLGVTVTIDGTKEKHDMHRRFRDGTGSYDIVSKNARLWISQFPDAATKVTFSSPDLPYLKDSIAHIWDMGIRNVAANVVYEDVWHDGDDDILETQMRELADYAIETGLWKTHVCLLFADGVGKKLGRTELNRNWCGGGAHMLAIDHLGKIYPCVRFMGYSLVNKKAVVLGDIFSGIDTDKLRPFQALDVPSQSSQECIECDVSGHCAWCQGYNYDTAKTETIYQRATAICKMHKARVRANDYYFARLANVRDQRIPARHKKTLYLVTGGNAVPICSYRTSAQASGMMSADTFSRGLEYAARNFLHSVVLQPIAGQPYALPPGALGWHAILAGTQSTIRPDIVVYDNRVPEATEAPVSVLLLDRRNVSRLSDLTGEILPVTNRLVVALRDVHGFTESDTAAYETQLDLVSAQAQRCLHSKEINIITDRLWLSEMHNCGAGVTSFALGPNGLLYICPGFYYSDPDRAVGSLETGVNQQLVELCKLDRAPVCKGCAAYHCRRCVLDNLEHTGELNIPARSQCVTSHLELKRSVSLRSEIPDGTWAELCQPFGVTSLDPLDRIVAGYSSRQVNPQKE